MSATAASRSFLRSASAAARMASAQKAGSKPAFSPFRISKQSPFSPRIVRYQKIWRPRNAIDRLNIDAFEVEEEARPDFPCPYCYEDFDIGGDRSLLQEKRPCSRKKSRGWKYETSDFVFANFMHINVGRGLVSPHVLAADPIASLIDTAFIGRLDSLGYVPLFLLENPLVVEAQQFCPS
ncbi:hypothetical protein NC651_010368 [Populus alba x Populus x berolinensis]|nr:hypothetical protein NC651_010368 [Populus alba x Populus x berolinensis]